MRKTDRKEVYTPLTVDITELAHLLCCGEGTAKQIGKDAKAEIHVGRRVVYKISLVEEYLDNLAKEQNND